MTLLSEQAYFNMAFLGLRDQGWRQSLSTMDPDPLCMYRGEGGLKCAVGHCFPDEAFVDGEATSIRSIVGNGPGSGEVFSLLRVMQDAHDKGDPRGMEGRFVEIATERSLTVPS